MRAAHFIICIIAIAGIMSVWVTWSIYGESENTRSRGIELQQYKTAKAAEEGLLKDYPVNSLTENIIRKFKIYAPQITYMDTARTERKISIDFGERIAGRRNLVTKKWVVFVYDRNGLIQSIEPEMQLTGP